MIIITGAAGFIGSNLLAGLEARNEGEIFVCDRLERKNKWKNIAKRELSNFIFPEDLKEFLDQRANEIDVIFHLGAISSTTEDDGDLLLKENYKLSLYLWQWAIKRGVRFIYASSAATYGDGAFGFDDDMTPEYLAQLRPMSGYAWSKHVFDRRVARLLSAGSVRPQQWAGLKFFNVYGPNEYHKGEQRSVVYSFYEQIQKDSCVNLFKSYNPDYADGEQLRDFVHVDDCVKVMLWLLDNPKTSGLFNVGTGNARSFLDVVNNVSTACGKEAKVEFIDMPETIRPNYQYRTEAKLDRLRAAGYADPFISLEDGIKDYVQNYLMAKDPYK